MTCPTCAIPFVGCIDMKCPRCVARTIISVRPRRDLQEQFFVVADKTPGGASRKDIVAAIKFIERGEA